MRQHPYRGNTALFTLVPDDLLPKRPMWVGGIPSPAGMILQYYRDHLRTVTLMVMVEM